MKQVPFIISTKDLAYLNDMFEWHLGASKKAHHYYTKTNDQDLKDAFLNVYYSHKNICNQILVILAKGENS